MKLPKNVLNRVKKIENWLEEYENEIFEHCYQAYHSSFKILWVRFGALQMLNCILYLLGKIKLNLQHWNEEKLIKNVTKHVKPGTFTDEIVKNLIQDELPLNKFQKGEISRVPVTPEVTIKYLGYYCLFKTVLKAIIKYVKNKRYKLSYFRVTEPYERLVEHSLSDLK